MFRLFLRRLAELDIGERLLNGGALAGCIAVFLPWMSGEWLRGEWTRSTGFQSYTGLLGTVVFVLDFFILCLTALPLLGRPQVVRKERKDLLRLLLASQASILTLAALAVLTSISFDFTRMEVRFGIYICLLGNILTAFEAFCMWREKERSCVREFFHTPDTEISPSPHARVANPTSLLSPSSTLPPPPHHERPLARTGIAG